MALNRIYPDYGSIHSPSMDPYYLSPAEEEMLQREAAERLAAVQEDVAGYMDDITAMFKGGVKITVIVRTPDFPDADFMMTSDEIPELRKLLDRRERAGKESP